MKQEYIATNINVMTFPDSKHVGFAYSFGELLYTGVIEDLDCQSVALSLEPKMKLLSITNQQGQLLVQIDNNKWTIKPTANNYVQEFETNIRKEALKSVDPEAAYVLLQLMRRISETKYQSSWYQHIESIIHRRLTTKDNEDYWLPHDLFEYLQDIYTKAQGIWHWETDVIQDYQTIPTSYPTFQKY